GGLELGGGRTDPVRAIASFRGKRSGAARSGRRRRVFLDFRGNRRGRCSFCGNRRGGLALGRDAADRLGGVEVRGDLVRRLGVFDLRGGGRVRDVRGSAVRLQRIRLQRVRLKPVDPVLGIAPPQGEL